MSFIWRKTNTEQFFIHADSSADAEGDDTTHVQMNKFGSPMSANNFCMWTSFGIQRKTVGDELLTLPLLPSKVQNTL